MSEENQKAFCGDKLTHTYDEARTIMVETLDQSPNEKAIGIVVDLVSYFLTVGFERDVVDSVLLDLVSFVREANDSFYEYMDAEDEKEPSAQALADEEPVGHA